MGDGHTQPTSALRLHPGLRWSGCGVHCGEPADPPPHQELSTSRLIGKAFCPLERAIGWSLGSTGEVGWDGGYTCLLSTHCFIKQPGDGHSQLCQMVLVCTGLRLWLGAGLPAAPLLTGLWTT